MPDHEVALELLARTGPLAVSSANRTGMPAATDADAGRGDAGRRRSRCSSTAARPPGAEPSTIVDVTGPQRPGAAARRASPLERLNEIVAPLGVEITDEG